MAFSMAIRTRSTAEPSNIIATQANNSFPFLDLPAELRNMIYAELLTTTETPPIAPSTDTSTWPGLLNTNRQMRLEALPMFCAAHTFEILVAPSLRDDLVRFFTDIGPSTTELDVTRFEILCPPPLATWTLEVRRPDGSMPKRNPLKYGVDYDHQMLGSWPKSPMRKAKVLRVFDALCRQFWGSATAPAAAAGDDEESDDGLGDE